jgi:hypothetical protein
VPRPKAFTRSDVDNRRIVSIRRASAATGPGIDATRNQISNKTDKQELERPDTRAIKAALSLNQKLLGAGMPEADAKEVERQVVWAFKAYNAQLTVETQERPAKIVAVLRRGLRPTKELLKWLDSLSSSVRLPLQMGDLEYQLAELHKRIKKRVEYERGHTTAGRPKSSAPVSLRQKLLSIVADTNRVAERTSRALVAAALADAGLEFPKEKKNRNRFTGAIKR